MSAFILHPASMESGARLAAYMGIPAYTAVPDSAERPDFLIRWGSIATIPLRPARTVFNSLGAISRKGNRLTQLTTLQDCGIKVPRFGISPLDTGPQLGRSHSTAALATSRGRGIVLYQAGPTPVGAHDFYVEYIPKSQEFRVDVICGRTRTRELLTPDPTSPAWNVQGSYAMPRQVPPTIPPIAVAAVQALGLDFGAVDVVVHHGTPYVLEVNTAPELAHYTLEWYAKQFSWVVGIDPEQMPGWSALEAT
jgi:hypothetical protein